MFSLVLLACMAYQTDLCTSEPPPGTGLRSDGRGIVHFMQPGIYSFRGLTVNRLEAGYFQAGGWGSVQATSSAPEWTRPDGVKERIPLALLYPPFD